MRVKYLQKLLADILTQQILLMTEKKLLRVAKMLKILQTLYCVCRQQKNHWYAVLYL